MRWTKRRSKTKANELCTKV